MNLPNKLTVLRVIMVPVFCGFPAVRTAGGTANTVDRRWSCSVVASLTDMLDGKIARNYGIW